MNAFRTLWRTDLRRGLHQLRMGLLIVPLLVVFMGVTQENARAGIALALGGTCAIYLAGWPSLVIRDRFDGTLDLLAGLPVSGELIARARLVAVATLSLLGGVQIGGAVALVLSPDLTPLRSAALVVGAGLGGWLFLTAASFLLCALLTRYTSNEATQRVVLGSLAIFFGGLWLMELADPDGEVLMRLLQTPLSLVALVLGTLGAAAILVGVRLMARGIDHFEPGPESVMM